MNVDTWKMQLTQPVPKTLKGPDAPTESERTAHYITHPPKPWCETRTSGRGNEAPHVRPPLERDERPSVAVDFAARMVRADHRETDDHLGTFLAMDDSRTGCMRATASETRGGTDRLASSVADFVKNLFVGRFRLRCDNEPSIMAVAEKVKAKMPDTAVVARDEDPRDGSEYNPKTGTDNTCRNTVVARETRCTLLPGTQRTAL